MAWKWPERAKKPNSAIVVFKLHDNNIFSQADGQEFIQDNDEWEKVIKYFRSNKDREKFLNNNMDKEDELLDTDYIFGLVADGGDWSNLNITPITPYRNHDNSLTKQLCIRSRRLAKKFYNSGKNVHKVIFFNEGKNILPRRDYVTPPPNANLGDVIAHALSQATTTGNGNSKDSNGKKKKMRGQTISLNGSARPMMD